MDNLMSRVVGILVEAFPKHSITELSSNHAVLESATSVIEVRLEADGNLIKVADLSKVSNLEEYWVIGQCFITRHVIPEEEDDDCEPPEYIWRLHELLSQGDDD